MQGVDSKPPLDMLMKYRAMLKEQQDIFSQFFPVLQK